MKRILLKLSGEALAGEEKQGFHEPTVRKVALQIKQLVEEGVQDVYKRQLTDGLHFSNGTYKNLYRYYLSALGRA